MSTVVVDGPLGTPQLMPPDARGLALLAFMGLWPDLGAPSWTSWRAILGRIREGTRELWVAAGRRAGKSRMGALIVTFMATREYERVPGENVYCAILAPDRRQARVSFRYVRGAFAAVPALETMIESETADSITLRNGVIIEVLTASLAAPRGRTYAVVVVEESAFLAADEQSANPDTEILRAVRPGLGQIKGSLLVVLSSPWARKGELWRAHQKFEATGGTADGRVVYVKAPTRDLNPVLDTEVIEQAYRDDATSANTEWGGEFRSDLESYVSVETLDACTTRGVAQREPEAGQQYEAFVDPAGGSGGDSMVLAIAHADPRERRRVLDLVIEVRPPFKPEEVVEQVLCPALARYGVKVAVGDAYAGDWPAEQFQKRGVRYVRSERSKSEIYVEALPALNNQRVVLLDSPRLRAQALGLERRASRGTGREVIDHAPGGHDDVVNAVLGAVTLVERGAERGTLTYTGSLLGGNTLRPWGGTDAQGREWRQGRRFNGTWPAERNMKGQPLTPPVVFVNGAQQPWTDADWRKARGQQ